MSFRNLIPIPLLFLIACTSPNKDQQVRKQVQGNWLIVYPDHSLNNAAEKKVYASIQDSIVALRGLKLVSLNADGGFIQADSPAITGQWGLDPSLAVFVRNGGKGFEDFAANYTAYNNGLLTLTEKIYVGNTRVKLVWNLKKVDGQMAEALFARKNVSWRQRPSRIETSSEMRQRLASMFDYYGAYYELVDQEAGYFIPSRVILPFRFYQHAVGLKSLEDAPAFVALFYDASQAKEAWNIIDAAMDQLKGKYPSSKSFVAEYAEFFRMIADQLETMDNG